MQRIFSLGIITAIIAALFPVVPVGAATVSELQEEARRICSRYQPRTNTMVLALDNTAKYTTLRAERGDLFYVIQTMSQNRYTDFQQWCQQMQTQYTAESAEATVQEAFNTYASDIAIDTIVLPLLDLLSDMDRAVETVSAVRDRLDDGVKNGVVRDAQAFASFDESPIAGKDIDPQLTAYITSAQQSLADAQSALPADTVFFTASGVQGTIEQTYTAEQLKTLASVYTQAPATAQTNIIEIQKNIRLAYTHARSGLSTVKRAERLIQDKLEAAALEQISPADKSEMYQSLYTSIQEKQASRFASDVRRYENNVRSLNRFKSDVEAMSILPTAVRSDILAEIERQLSALNTIITYMGTITSIPFSQVASKQQEYELYKYKNTVYPALRLISRWESALEDVYGESSAVVATESGLQDLVANMQSSEKQQALQSALGASSVAELQQVLQSINLTQFNSQIAALSAQAQLLFNPTTDKVNQGLPVVRQASDTTRDAEVLAVYKRLVSSFTKNVRDENRKVSQARKIWLTLIKQAAQQGGITDSDLFAEDVRAQKIIDQFNRNRARYYERVTDIVSDRIEDINKEQEKILMRAIHIPSDAQLDFTPYITTLTQQLQDVQSETVMIADYFDLRDRVRGIRDIGVRSVFIRVQKLYYTSDRYFNRLEALQSVASALQSITTALPDTSAERETLLGDVTNLQSSLNAIDSALKAVIAGPLQGALDAREDAVDSITLEVAEELYDMAKDDLRTQISALNDARRESSQLLRRLQDAQDMVQEEQE